MSKANDEVSGTIANLKLLWWGGGVIVSVGTALLTTTLYINNLFSTISRLDKQVAAINQTLAFDTKIDRRAVTFNGNEEDPKCPPGAVMRGVRISYQNITSEPHGSIDCVSLKPAQAQ